MFAFRAAESALSIALAAALATALSRGVSAGDALQSHEARLLPAAERLLLALVSPGLRRHRVRG